MGFDKVAPPATALFAALKNSALSLTKEAR